MLLALRPQIFERMRGMSEPDAYELAVQITATLARGIGSVSGTVGDRHPAYRCAERFKATLKLLADRAESHPVGATDLLDIVAATANEIWRIAAFQSDPFTRERLRRLARPICDSPELVVSRKDS